MTHHLKFKANDYNFIRKTFPDLYDLLWDRSKSVNNEEYVTVDDPKTYDMLSYAIAHATTSELGEKGLSSNGVRLQEAWDYAIRDYED
ncbi:hypothetical protein [Limosilactobacillus caecicola]|uniref:hypothetical protein n=1 Tax=Limosilactobacillus caecicola TaxID=2941332 RepID=UPI00203EE28C|nr:hypothetical protein [Limosilactobacillus caecicola]